jgi:hypothetical protein
MADPMISPKKNDHIWMGWFTRRYSRILARVRTDIRIPPTTESRKLPFTAFQKAGSPSLQRVLMVLKLIFLME